jgi:hypothetical protein
MQAVFLGENNKIIYNRAWKIEFKVFLRENTEVNYL